ncbi:hypothetical protein GCM10028818_55450 [Spirosoma horti]
MVVRISSGATPSGAVKYNEEKVGKGEAERLAVRNFRGVDVLVEQLDFSTIATKLEERASLNERIKKPTFHASLSLAQGEKPAPEELTAIADRYMEGMGYGRQPYAIYQHFDTDHTHIHIVSVRVDERAKKIPDNYERERSNKLRQGIEKEFNLQPAEKAKVKQERTQLVPVEYGKGNLKQDISDVVTGILRDFKFSSFNQYNQLLGLYNVRATEVPQEGKKPGLVYSAIDRNLIAVGATFRASQLPYQPTMEAVNRRISSGKKIKGDKVSDVRRKATLELGQSKGWGDFQQRLSGQGIGVIPHLGKDDNLFGISFVDVKSRAIYTGSELGKTMTAGALKGAFGAYETTQFTVPLIAQAQQVDRSQNWSYQEDTMEAAHRRDEAMEFVRNNPYIKPTIEQKKEIERQNKEFGQQNKDEFKTEREQSRSQQNEKMPMQNLDLIRQLLYALDGPADGQEEEHELAKMLKRARKPSR